MSRVQTRVAMGVIAGVEVHLGHVHRAAGAFGDILAGHLDMDAAAMRALGTVDGEEAAHFGEDALERTRLVAVGRLDDIAVHRVARPDDGVTRFLHRAHQLGQVRLDLVVAVARDQRHAPRDMVRVQRIEQAQQHVGLEARAALHADRIADAAQIFDMRRPFEAGAVADPQEMARGVVPAAGQAVLPGERLLVREQQRLMAGIEAGALDLRDRFGRDAAGFHEGERFRMEKGFVPMYGADGWQLANSNVLALAAHQASLDIFQEAGMENLRAKSEKLTAYLEFLIEQISGKSGVLEIITPKNPAERGCQLSLLIHRGGKAVFDEFYKNGVVGDWRNPNVIRLAPTPLYNSFLDVFRFAKILEQSLEKFA